MSLPESAGEKMLFHASVVQIVFGAVLGVAITSPLRWPVLCILSGTLFNWPLKTKKKQNEVLFPMGKKVSHKTSHTHDGEKVITCRNFSSLSTEMNLRNVSVCIWKSQKVVLLRRRCCTFYVKCEQEKTSWHEQESQQAQLEERVHIQWQLNVPAEKVGCFRWAFSSHYFEWLLSLKAGKRDYSSKVFKFLNFSRPMKH